MDKRLFAMVLAFCLCFHVPAYASGASSSDALKVGAALDAEPWHSLDVGLDDDFGVMPLVDGLYGQDWFYQSAWLNTETQKAEYFIVKRSNGRYLWENPDPDVYTPLPRFTVYLTKSTLPAPGTYNLKWRMDSANAYPTINRLAFQYVLRKANTAPLYESLVSAGFHTHNTYWNGNTNITIPSNLSDLTLIFYINQPSDNLHPFDMGEFTYTFYQKTDASADGSVSPPSAPPSTPEQDIANDLGIISGVVDSISGAFRLMSFSRIRRFFVTSSWILSIFCVNSCFTDSTCFSTMFEIANNSSLSLMAFSPFVSVNGIIWALVSQAAVSALGGKSAWQRRLRTVLGRQDLLRKWNKK